MKAMQKIKLLWLAGAIMACQQEVGYNPRPPQQYGAYYWGEVSGTRNGVLMLNPRIVAALYENFPREACDKDKFSISIREFDDSGCQRLSLGLRDIPREIGTSTRFQHKLNAVRCHPQLLPHVALYLMKCDIYLGSYLVDSLKQSELNIAAFDTTTREVRGSFKIHFRLNERPNQEVLVTPDSLYYEATFKTKLLPEGQSRYQ